MVKQDNGGDEFKSLTDLVDRAMERLDVAYVTDLERIARTAGHKINRTTINSLKNGTYNRRPGRAVLEALAYLAGVSYATALKAAGLGEVEVPFASRLPADVDILTPREQEALLALLRAMIETRRANTVSVPDEQRSKVLGIAVDDLTLPNGDHHTGESSEA